MFGIPHSENRMLQKLNWNYKFNVFAKILITWQQSSYKILPP